VEALLDAECERARTRASLALDCELSELDRAHLRRHLATCAACAAFVGGLHRVTTELRAAPLPRPPRPFVPRRRRIPAVTGICAVVCAAAAGSLAGSLRHAEQPVRIHATGAQFAAVFSAKPAKRPASRLLLRAPV
jgi:anti-sigma factor RsiW